MAEQTAILAEKHLAVFMSPDQCFSDLITPEKDPGITGASSPFFDYLLAEGNEVGDDLERKDELLPGAGNRLENTGTTALDCGSSSWQNSRSEDRFYQLDDDCTEVLSAAHTLYNPGSLLPHMARRIALHPIAEQELPSSDDFEPWSFLCEAATGGSYDGAQPEERYNSTDSCASLACMPLDIDTAMCDSLTSPAWALDSSEPMLFDMPVAVTPRDGMGGGLQTSMSWGYPAHTAQAAEPLAFLSEDAMLEDMCCMASLRPAAAHNPATDVEEPAFLSPQSIWQDLIQPGLINTTASGAVAPPLQGMQMAGPNVTVAWHQQLPHYADSGAAERAQAQASCLSGTPAAALAVPAQAPAGRGLDGRPCCLGSLSKRPVKPQGRQPAQAHAHSGSQAKACGMCKALNEPPAGMGPTAFTFTASDSLAAFLEQHMCPLTATPPREGANTEQPTGCPRTPKAGSVLDLHLGLHQGLCLPGLLSHDQKAAHFPWMEAPAPAAAAAEQDQQAMAVPAPGPAPGQATGREVCRSPATAISAARKPANQVPPAARQVAAAAALAGSTAHLKAVVPVGATATTGQSHNAGLSAAEGAATVKGPSTPPQLSRCPPKQSGRQPGPLAQLAAAISAATADEAGSEDKAGNDCNDDDRSCTTASDGEDRGAKRNRAHQKDYTQRKRSRVAAVHNCALELKKRRAELESQVATAIAKHQMLTESLPWQKQLEEAQFMAMLGSFRTSALKELEKAACKAPGTSGHAYMQDPLEVCEKIVWTGCHAPAGRVRRSWTDEMEGLQASMSPIARQVLSDAAGDMSRAANTRVAPPMSEIVAKIRLSKAQKSELAAVARRTVTCMEMIRDHSAAAAERLQGSLPLLLGSLHNIWRGMLVTHTVLSQLSGIPKMAAECSSHLVCTCAQVLKPAQAKKLPQPVHGSLGICLSLCEEVERIRHRQGAVCRASVAADAAPVAPRAADASATPGAMAGAAYAIERRPIASGIPPGGSTLSEGCTRRRA